MLKMLDLFSGIGGISLGAEMTGCIETVGFCEIEPFCQKVLKKHWPDVPIYPDIKELKAEDVGSIDIITGGAPCQPFSVAGKHTGTTDDRHLWPEMFRLVRETRPSWIIFENVPGIISVALDEIQDNMEEEGYKSWTFLYGANLFGAEHKRNRVFAVASSNSNTESQRMERLWPEGVEIPQPLVKTLLPLRNSNGQWETEPDFRRTDDGIPGRVDKHKSARLKALGNAVVPQQIYPIFWAIAELETGRGSSDD